MGRWLDHGFAVAAAAACIARLWELRRSVAGTTLQAPRRWAMTTLAGVPAVEVAHGAWQTSLLTRDPWHYLAVAWTLCPFLAMLGAKRPQDRGWQWIVLSLAIVLWLPVGQSAAFGDQQFALPIAWRWLIGALLTAQVLNYAGTRNLWRAACISGAQGVWMTPYLFENRLAPIASHAADRWGWLLLLSAVWIPARKAAASQPPLDRTWHRFRDAYGIVWARRVADRVNQTASLAGWPVVLRWSGFQWAQNQPTGSSLQRQVADALSTPLRRFVSPAWIDRSMQSPT